MPRWHRAYATVCVSIIGFAVAYVLCDYGKWPRLVYAPYERTWRLTSEPTMLDSTYVGTVLWGLGGALCGAALAWLVTGALRRELSRRSIALLGAWALSAFVYGGLYYTWNLWPF